MLSGSAISGDPFFLLEASPPREATSYLATSRISCTSFVRMASGYARCSHRSGCIFYLDGLIMVDFTETAMRKMCRNPRCGCKLPAPVSNPREAFCARGCHSSFYRKRCLVCEEPMDRKTERQLVCGKRKCRNALQGSFDGGRYHVSSRTISPLKKPIKSGIKSSFNPDRTPPWRVVAAGSPISANQYHCAIVGAEEATAAADRINAAHWKAAKCSPSAPLRQITGLHEGRISGSS
jgi:hypothetical protein